MISISFTTVYYLFNGHLVVNYKKTCVNGNGDEALGKCVTLSSTEAVLLYSNTSDEQDAKM